MIRTLSTTLCAAMLLGSASLYADELNIYSLAQQPQQRHLEHYQMVRNNHDEYRHDRDFRDERRDERRAERRAERREERWERWRDNRRRHWAHRNHWDRHDHWRHERRWNHWRNDDDRRYYWNRYNSY